MYYCDMYYCNMYYCGMHYTILIARNYRSLYYLSFTVLYDMHFTIFMYGTICHVVYYL